MQGVGAVPQAAPAVLGPKRTTEAESKMVKNWFDTKRNRWHLYWGVEVNGHSAQCHLTVSVSACSGDKDAAERVASRLKDHIASTFDRSDASLFWGVRDKLIADELARLQPEWKKETRSSRSSAEPSRVDSRTDAGRGVVPVAKRMCLDHLD